MKRSVILLAAVTLFALSACSSSVGTGSAPPEHTTVVVPSSN